MFFSITFLIYIIYFILKLYNLVDKLLIFSGNGTKLRKYISAKDLQNITSNEGVKQKDHLYKFFNQFKSPKWCKKIIIKILVSLTIIAIYLVFTYSKIFSNFLFLNIFGKNISLNNLFGDTIIYIQIIYIFVFCFFIFSITNKIINFIFKSFNKDNSNIIPIKNGIEIDIAEDSNKNKIKLLTPGLYQNILITGSIGSGKTSSAILNIVDSLIKSGLGGLIIDVKGSMIYEIEKICSKYNMNNKLKVISLNSSFKYNPIDNENVLEYELSSRIRQALELFSAGSKNTDSFWLDKVQDYIKSFIIIIKEYNGYASFSEIHKLVIDKNYLQEKIELLKGKMLSNNYNDEKLYKITSAINMINLEYFKLDERTLSIIKAEITRITSPFVSSSVVEEKFCSKNKFSFADSSNIVVLTINIGENKTLAKLISTYMKLDFQKSVLAKVDKKPSFFICDEYQEFVNKEDADFFSLSREYKCINVISMQSYSSLLNTLQDEYVSRVIIQNLVNKIWFRNDDVYTISQIIKQIGKEEKEYKTLSVSEGGKESKYNVFFNRFTNIKSNLTESYSVTKKDEYILNEEYFSRILNTFEAAVLLSDGMKIKFIKKCFFKRWEE